MTYNPYVVPKEEAFRRFERAQARNERARYVRKGIIVPSPPGQPTLMVKDGENWRIKVGSRA